MKNSSYAKKPADQLVKVAFACQTDEPKDEEVYQMIDRVIYQLFGEKG